MCCNQGKSFCITGVAFTSLALCFMIPAFAAWGVLLVPEGDSGSYSGFTFHYPAESAVTFIAHVMAMGLCILCLVTWCLLFCGKQRYNERKIFNILNLIANVVNEVCILTACVVFTLIWSSYGNATSDYGVLLWTSFVSVSISLCFAIALFACVPKNVPASERKNNQGQAAPQKMNNQTYPANQGQYPPPQGQYPPPQGQYPPPQGQYPPPQGQYPSPQGQYPPPQGQYQPSQGQQGRFPPPQGQYPPPQGQQGQYPLPYGQYPPPQGQYPPPRGQYPPPQGQYPPPQGHQGPYPPIHTQTGPYPPVQGQNPQAGGQSNAVEDPQSGAASRGLNDQTKGQPSPSNAAAQSALANVATAAVETTSPQAAEAVESAEPPKNAGTPTDKNEYQNVEQRPELDEPKAIGGNDSDYRKGSGARSSTQSKPKKRKSSKANPLEANTLAGETKEP